MNSEELENQSNLNSSLKHYGIKRRSGRYPYGSGEDAFRRASDLRGMIERLSKQGLSKKEIAKALNFVDHNGEGNIRQLTNAITDAKAIEVTAKIAQANRLLERGNSYRKIAEIMQLPNESSVRSLLDPTRQERAKRLDNTTELLLSQLKSKRFLDVGAGIEYQLGVRRPILDAAIQRLESLGYKVHSFPLNQIGTGKETRMKVLTNEDYKTLMQNRGKIRMIDDWSDDGGLSFNRLQPVKSLDSSRIQVRFDSPLDGMIQLRRGVKDLSLEDKHHAQVRISVDGTHYMKGMAVYKDDMPKGIDVIYNTSKSEKVGKLGAMKLHESSDPTNPFATLIRQKTYIDSNGQEQLSPMNRVGYSKKVIAGEEGYWDSWRKDLSSQFLSKQSVDVAKKQLDIALNLQKDRYNEIMQMTNPLVKQRLLGTFSDDCDSKAFHLRGAPLPGQSTKVLIGLESLKEGEVYAPGYKNGQNLLLVRFPHAGTFEIPSVIVNNKNVEGQKVLGKTNIDAIGIHPSVAQKLSGADFDGDHVVAFYNNSKLKSSESLKSLRDFNNKVYQYPDSVRLDSSFKKMSDRTKAIEMGKVTNLITDMSIKGASLDEIGRGVKHSMVVIDAQKHDLNYKQSAIDNRISDLKIKYQGGVNAGASTFISRAGAEDVHSPKVRALTRNDPGYDKVVRGNDWYSIDKITGERKFVTVEPKVWVNSKGETVIVQPTQKSHKMDRISNAKDLLSPNPSPMERVYADYANEMKKIGNQSRLSLIDTESTKYSPQAAKVYKEEVAKLTADLNLAKRNAPFERQAQVLANEKIKIVKENNPNLSSEQIKKISSEVLTNTRELVSASKKSISLTDRGWEAIQAGALRPSVVKQILNNTKEEDIVIRATPRSSKTLSPNQITSIKSKLNNGYTIAEVAESLGISSSTVQKYR